MSSNQKSQFEDLPNELFYQYTIYLTANDLYESFFNLNLRYNSLLKSLTNLCYEIDSTVSQQEIQTKFYFSRINKLMISEQTTSVSISNQFNNISSIIFYRPIRLNQQLFLSVKFLKIDLTNIRVKQFNHLFSLIFSNQFSSLSTLEILHRKSSVIGHWKILIDSIKNPSFTNKQFLFDIKPTFHWNMFEHILKFLPNLEKLFIKQLNTRSKWSLNHFQQLINESLINLNYLSIYMKLLNTNQFINKINQSKSIHPLFQYIQANKSNTKNSYTIIRIQSHS